MEQHENSNDDESKERFGEKAFRFIAENPQALSIFVAGVGVVASGLFTGSKVIPTGGQSILAKTIEKGVQLGKTVPVKAHLRNLPKGWHASSEQFELAKKLGIALEENQTLVTEFLRKVT